MAQSGNYPNHEVHASWMYPQQFHESSTHDRLTPPSPQAPTNFVQPGTAFITSPFPNQGGTTIAHIDSRADNNQPGVPRNGDDPPQIPMPPDAYARFVQLQESLKTSQYAQGTVMPGIPASSHFMGPPPGAVSISHPAQAFGILTPPVSPIQSRSPVSSPGPSVFQSIALNTFPAPPMTPPPNIRPPLSRSAVQNSGVVSSAEVFPQQATQFGANMNQHVQVVQLLSCSNPS